MRLCGKSYLCCRLIWFFCSCDLIMGRDLTALIFLFRSIRFPSFLSSPPLDPWLMPAPFAGLRYRGLQMVVDTVADVPNCLGAPASLPHAASIRYDCLTCFRCSGRTNPSPRSSLRYARAAGIVWPTRMMFNPAYAFGSGQGRHCLSPPAGKRLCPPP